MAEEAENVKIIYVVATPPKNLKKDFATKPAIVLGVLQISCAVLIIILGFCARYTWFGLIADITCSVFIFVSGLMSLGSARTGNRCLIITTMVFCIVSSIIGAFQGQLGVGHIVHARGHCQHIIENYGNVVMDKPYFININNTPYKERSLNEVLDNICDKSKPETGFEHGLMKNGTHLSLDHPCTIEICSSVQLATHSLLLVIGIIVMVATITTAALTCKVTCCYRPPQGAQPTVVYNKSYQEEDERELGKYVEF